MEFNITSTMAITIKPQDKAINFNDSTVKTQLNLYDILIPTIGGIIILLNFAVVISSGLILKKGQQPRSTYLFLGNVAMTDLITGIAVVFGQLYPKTNRDHYVCAIQLGMIVSSTLASVYSVGLIGIDRFLYIVHGIQYQQWVYPTRARLLILFSWFIGCLIGFMPLFGWYGDTDNGRICWFILLAPKYLIFLTVIVGMIPLIIVIILYLIILYHAITKINQLKRSRQFNSNHRDSVNNLRMFRGGANKDNDNIENGEPTNKKKTNWRKIFTKQPTDSVKSPSKWKAIKVVLFTTLSFIISWFPYFIACIIYVYKCKFNETKQCRSLQIVIASPLAILGFTNSLINPIIYAWWHKGFREYVQQRFSFAVEKVRRASNVVGNTAFQIGRRATTSRKESTISTNMKSEQNVSSKSTDNEQTVL